MLVRIRSRLLAVTSASLFALLASLVPSPLVGTSVARAAGQALPHMALPNEVTRLDNGLEVVLHEDHRTPIVTVDIWYHVGSKDEAPGKSGFAHLFEHVMFQGSKHVPEDTYFRSL